MPEPALVRSLTTLVGDTASFYLQAHAAHWNVEAPNFAELHKFFGKLYEDVHEALDPLAEYLRTHAAEAPCSLKSMIEASTIPAEFDGHETPTGGYLGIDLLTHLSRLNQAYLKQLNSTYSAATSAGDLGLANFLQERMTAHRRWMWQLRSFTERG